jgi:hypothetical protein
MAELGFQTPKFRFQSDRVFVDGNFDIEQNIHFYT